MIRIWKQFDFSAAHFLPHVPEDHPCRNLHGHNYKVTMEIEADSLDHQGFVVDFNSLDFFKDWLNNTFDHGRQGILNDVLDNPTSELLARYIADNSPWVGNGRVRLYSVTVQESDKTGATWFVE